MTEDEREHETAKRLDAFVDAAFAFAVTLLVIAGAEGPPSLAALGAAMGRIPASLGAFVLIAMFWMAYRDFGRIAPRRDAWASLNGLAIVFVVLVYVFPPAHAAGVRLRVDLGRPPAGRGDHPHPG